MEMDDETDMVSTEEALTMLAAMTRLRAAGARDVDVRDLARTVIALRAIIEGRTEPPTDAEIEAHRTVGGGWRWVVLNNGRPTLLRGESLYPPSVYLDTTETVRWWALDANWCLCAWPEVSR